MSGRQSPDSHFREMISHRYPPSSVFCPQYSAAQRISRALTNFAEWLDAYGETSWDYQSFFAGPVGGRAKALYYRHRLVGTAAVAPMVFFEAFFPAARRLFYHPVRFPIVDAHYAMGFAFLYQVTGDSAQLERAVHFLNMLKDTRCRQPSFSANECISAFFRMMIMPKLPNET